MSKKSISEEYFLGKCMTLDQGRKKLNGNRGGTPISSFDSQKKTTASKYLYNPSFLNSI